MSFDKINSWAKINLSLNVVKRFRSKYHKIESLITFVEIFDEIKIRFLKGKKNKIYFTGKFAKGIGKNNTISKLLNLLEKNLSPTEKQIDFLEEKIKKINLDDEFEKFLVKKFRNWLIKLALM